MQENLEICTKFLNDSNIFFEKNFDLKKKSWLKAGGKFELYIQPENLEDIIKIISFFKENKIKFYIVGNISNIIFRDGIIKTPIINLKKFNKIKEINNSKDSIELEVSCGISIYKFVSNVSINNKISGLEGLVGIPGSLGGGIYMNASSYDSYISEYLKEVHFINNNCEIIKLKKKEIKFSWRSSIFHKKKDFIILSAIFSFPKKNIKKLELINEKIKKVKNHREKFQEKNLPNLGSLFATKNLYEDIAKASLLYNILYLFNKFITKVIFKFFNTNLLIIFRKFIVRIYSLLLGIKKNDCFKLSDRTINCLVNKNSSSANEAIKIIRKYEKKINYSQKLENIIMEEIN
jgi:UDP-N-acetylmuramate dehydrogenase